MKSDISGFPEFLPNEQIVFEWAKNVATKSFESYGFCPMDTAAVERVETLLSKGNDHEIYGLYRLTDPSEKKEFGLRFDLTVPLARYVAKYHGDLIFPFKRYHIAPVWRGERPQYGRYRQFYQCDIDVVGDEALSLNYDAEIICIIIKTLKKMGVPPFHVYINNRKILSGFLKTIVSEQQIVGAMRLLDKSDKLSFEGLKAQFLQNGVDDAKFERLQNFLNVDQRGSIATIIDYLKDLRLNDEFVAGVNELENVLQILKQLDINDNYLRISMKLARGLDYYTGSVFETKLDNVLDLGSIAGGGRYDNLTGLLSDHVCPGVGASIGLSRLIPKLIEKGLLDASKHTTTQLLVTVQQSAHLGAYLRIAEQFRKFGANVEVYLHDKPLAAQLKYASRKHIKYVFIANDVELLDEIGILRNMETKEQQKIHIPSVGNSILELIK